VLDLAGANDGLSGTIPARLLSNLRYATRRAGAIGRLHIGRAEESSISAALDVLFELHSSRWRTRGQDGVLSKTAIQEFHRDVARQFLQRDWLRLYVLRIGQDIVAASYGFCLRGKSYYYIGGFDPHFAKLSPGALIVGYAITDAVREQARTFDFLRGAEDYKYKWGARDRRQFRIRAVAAKSRATAASWK
jgi:CelD/BcsL family acetyltransferase involved in cellulose biosynthesis